MDYRIEYDKFFRNDYRIQEARRKKELDAIAEREIEARIEQRKKECTEDYDRYIRKRPEMRVWDVLKSCYEDADDVIGIYNTVRIDRVKIDGLWTIIFWSDGVVSKAKCSLDDEFDPEVGIMVAICNRLFRTPQNFKKILKNLIKDAEVPTTGGKYE